MKSIIIQFLPLCFVPNVFTLAMSLNPTKPQKPLAQVESMAETENPLKVPGNNNSTYGPTPKSDQLFKIEYYEIAPNPIPVDRIFFQLLRGHISLPSPLSPSLLNTSTLTLSSSATLSSGEIEPLQNLTIPLKTIAFTDTVHLAIRNERGEHVEYLSEGYNDILVDYWIPGMFLKTGWWSFGAVGRLGEGEGEVLFDLGLTQWLVGRNN